ncbi:MAG: hypothetical protein PHQ65_08430 [Bacteroidales bacterium]|nr:hypothetical protein [Bacteroidales bacterium]MDD3665277.1 hypothetical protein [Bacteroidales bacterium]
MSYKNRLTPLLGNIFFCAVILFGVYSCTEIVDVNISDKKVELLTPPDSLVSLQSTIGFKWNSVADADNYNVQIVTPSFLSPSQWLLDTTMSATSLLVSLPSGNYEWRVKGMNFSYETCYSSRSFTIVKSSDITQEIVTLLRPIDNDTNNLKMIEFRWRAVVGADSYKIQLLCQQAVLFEEETDQLFFLASPEMGDGQYTWKVKGMNDQYSTVYFSHTFISDTTPPGVRTLIAPAHASLLVDTTVNFTWSRSGTVLSKETDSLLIYTDSLLTKRYKAVISHSTSKTIALENGTYYWTVRGYDRAGNSSSPADTFRLKINSGRK